MRKITGYGYRYGKELHVSVNPVIGGWPIDIELDDKVELKPVTTHIAMINGEPVTVKKLMADGLLKHGDQEQAEEAFKATRALAAEEGKVKRAQESADKALARAKDLAEKAEKNAKDAKVRADAAAKLAAERKKAVMLDPTKTTNQKTAAGGR